MGGPKRHTFTRDEDYKMTEMIKNLPALYDWSHDLAKDTVFRDKLWIEIGLELNKPHAICKKRWKTIRHAYMRYRRELTKCPGTAWKCLDWHFWPRLQFLNICLLPNKYIGSAEALVENEPADLTQDLNSGDCYEEESTEMIVTPDPSTETSIPLIADPLSEALAKEVSNQSKRNRKHVRKTNKEGYYSDGLDHDQDDAVDTFFKSMAMSVKKLPANLIIKARMDICNIVSKYELETMNLPRSPSSKARRKKSKASRKTMKHEVYDLEDSSDGEN